MPQVGLQLVDLVHRLVVTDDARALPIVDIIDARGRPALTHEDAVLAVAGAPGEWLSVKLAPYDRRAFH